MKNHSRFSVQDGVEFGLDSDHSTLLWKFYLFPSVTPSISRTQNPPKNIKSWSSYARILNQRLEASSDLFSTLSCAEQGEYIKHQLQTAGMSASPGTQENHRRNPNQSLEMRKLLKRSKIIKKSLKLRQTISPNTVKKLREDRKELADLIRFQSYTDSLNTKKRIKQILLNKGRKASQLFWYLVNHKP